MKTRGSGKRRAGPFDSILRGVERHPDWRGLFERLGREESETLDITGLTGSLGPCIVAAAYLRSPRPWLIVTANADKAATWQEDLAHILGAERVARFNAWETLPYEFRTPGPEATGRRLETLWRILDSRDLVVVTHLRAALEPTIPPPQLRSALVKLHVGETIQLDLLLRSLVELGYRSQPIIEQAATFSHRGGIIDVFSYTEPEPLRIELLGDTIESIRTFSVSTQRSTSRRENCTILPSREVMSSGAVYEQGWKSSGLGVEWRERVEYDPERPGLEWLAATVGQPRARLFDYFDRRAVQLTEEFDLMSGEFERLQAEAQIGNCRMYRVPRPFGEMRPHGRGWIAAHTCAHAPFGATPRRCSTSGRWLRRLSCRVSSGFKRR
jgi:transcription-repair coupling factor (superfamily II helicase)